MSLPTTTPGGWEGGCKCSKRLQVCMSQSQTHAMTQAPQHEKSVSCFFHALTSGKLKV